MLVTAVAAVLFTSSCVESPSGPTATSAALTSAPLPSSVAVATLIECPTSLTTSSGGLVGLLGGTLNAAGIKIKFPFGAVGLLTQFELVVPASQYMEISVSAVGLGHYLFGAPVTLTIDYSRCPDSVLERGPLSVYYIDENTKALLQNMGGVDDRANRKITFTTDHLSGYAIAN
jgi:hypothetical protein